MTNIAIETGDLWWIFPLKMVIFHSYKLPEGTMQCLQVPRSRGVPTSSYSLILDVFNKPGYAPILLSI